MTLLWSIVEPDGLEDDIFREELVAEAWHLWELASCVERNGGHRWVAYLDGNMIDDGEACGGDVYLSCEGCPAQPGDIYPDFAADDLAGSVGGAMVDAGRHLSDVDIERPVTLTVKVERTPPNPINGGGEVIAAWLEVTDR